MFSAALLHISVDLQNRQRGKDAPGRELCFFDHIVDLKRVARNNDDRAKIRCLADYMTQHPEYSTVPDPYYGTGRDFELALDLIEDACREVAERLTKETI